VKLYRLAGYNYISGADPGGAPCTRAPLFPEGKQFG